MAIGRSILRRMFGRPTGLLGWLGGHILARTNRGAARRAIDLLDVRPGDRALEIGFGPGVGIEMLAARTPRGWVAGIDPSAEMVRQAARRNARAIAEGRVDLRCGSAEHLAFGDETFDKIAAINSMQLWPDAVTGMREVRRVLKGGGRLVVGFTPYARQSNDAVLTAIIAAGFADPHVVDSPEILCLVAAKP
jgi:ubiquinone/menaquinone biosynthesis C-methylase UbiE